FGSVFEDALAWVPDAFRAGPAGDTTYYGRRYVGLGRLDTERDPITHSWNAVINDEGILADRVTDGIVDSTTGAVRDTLPLCSATQHGLLQTFFFGDLRSRCGRHNGFVDTEDLDGDFRLDSVAGVRTVEVMASVVSTENRDLGYTPPPGVFDEAGRRDANLQLATAQINERSLRLLAGGLQTGQRAEAFLRFTAEGDKNFLKYRRLRT